eukprot:scaffold571185_cov19-Prasinocladus_malaysianus.AAC.1
MAIQKEAFIYWFCVNALGDSNESCKSNDAMQHRAPTAARPLWPSNIMILNQPTTVSAACMQRSQYIQRRSLAVETMTVGNPPPPVILWEFKCKFRRWTQTAQYE